MNIEQVQCLIADDRILSRGTVSILRMKPFKHICVTIKYSSCGAYSKRVRERILAILPEGSDAIPATTGRAMSKLVVRVAVEEE
jgi:hypothetical protein